MNWPSVERLFASALETPPGQRQALLDSDPDPTVRAEVSRLLAKHDALCAGQDEFLKSLDLTCAAALAVPPEPEDPQTVGRYEILRRLGRGATGVVYLARDPSLDRRVALKLLSPDLSHDATGIRRFTEEARAASRLDNPHIIAVHEISRADDGRLFIAMVYHEGVTLRERLAGGALPVVESLRIAADVADGLSAAHLEGIVHRDIKPENILLTARGACILDFGIAKVTGETLTATGAPLGTAAYMSPEQTRGIGVDHRSDLWSLGVVLYEMLSGRRPFHADGGEALVYQIRNDPPTAMPVLQPEVPDSVAALVQRCLQKEPDRRYQSADALLSELRGPTAGRQNRAAQRAGLVACGVLALTLGYSAYASRNGPAVPRQLSTVLPRTPRPGSIAIIPFTTPDSTSGRDYVTPGLTAELVRGLGSTPGIQVASWRSVHQAMSRDSAVPAMGRELGVAAVLKGTVRRAGDSVIIAAHLARSSDGRVLWSRSFDATAGKAIIAAEEVRHAVTVALGVHDSSRASRTERHAAADLVVYDLYLRGRLAYDKRTPAGLQEAALLFREAIARDSSFARAYVGLADVYTAPQSGPAAEGFRRAKPLIAHALAQDSMLAAAHKAAGWIAMWYDRDWSGAERHLRRALALDSSDVWAYHWYAGYLGAVGRTDESLAITRQATALDPVSSATATHVGIHLFWRRRYGEAIAVLERALEVDTTWARTHLVLARVYLAVGRHEDAIRELRRPGLQYAAFEPEAVLAYALGISGHLEEARDMAAKFEARARASLARPIDLVAVHLGLRDTARALEWVERIPEDRGSMFFLLTEPMYEPIRKSARFRRVLEKLGLPDAAIPADSTEAVGPAAQPTTFRRPS